MYRTYGSKISYLHFRDFHIFLSIDATVDMSLILIPYVGERLSKQSLLKPIAAGLILAAIMTVPAAAQTADDEIVVISVTPGRWKRSPTMSATRGASRLRPPRASTSATS